MDSRKENEWVVCDLNEFEEQETDDGFLRVSIKMKGEK